MLEAYNFIVCSIFMILFFYKNCCNLKKGVLLSFEKYNSNGFSIIATDCPLSESENSRVYYKKNGFLKLFNIKYLIIINMTKSK